MVRFSSTDLATNHLGSSGREMFLAERQVDIWNLPVYERFDIRSPSAFMLMYVILDSVGLTDGRDAIGRSVSESEAWQFRVQQCGGGRRSKLVCFCLHFLELSLDVWKDEAMASVVSACIGALVNGLTVPPASVFMVTIERGLPLSLGLPNDSTLTCLVDFKETPAPMNQPPSGFVEVFSGLWSPPLDPPEHCIFPVTDDFMDIVRVGLQTIYLQAASRERLRKSVNTIGSSQSNRLFVHAISSLERTLSRCVGEVLDPISEGKEEGDIDEDKTSSSPVPLSLRTTVLKGYLTLLLSRRVEDLATSWESLTNNISTIFRLSSTSITSLGRDQDELAFVLSDLVRIVRGLVSANSELGLRWPGPLIQSASSLYNLCEELLNDYVAGNAEEEKPVSVQRNKAELDTLMDDDIPHGDISHQDSSSLGARREHDDASSRKKRKRQVGYTRRQQRRSSEVLVTNLSQKCSYLLGALFLALNPTFKDCEFVAKTLLGIDELGEEGTSEFDVDVWGGIYAVGLICTKHIVSCVSPDKSLSDDQLDIDRGSIACLICEIIRTVRLSAKPHCNTHLFGHSYCADLVLLRDRNLWSASMESSEAKKIVELLMVSDRSQERRGYLLRPHFRAQQLQAATSAFRNGAENFHAEFDNLFGPNFVLPSLSDVSSAVRRHASAAVAAALLVMTEDKVIATVRRRLPPVTSRTTEVDLLKQYRSWYANKSSVGASGESGSETENQVRDDAYVSMQHDVIACWSVIAETSSSREVLQQVLFDLIRLAVMRPSLEGLCFQAVERIACRKGFGAAENLLDAECRNLAHRWLETGDSLFDVPLMIASPSAFRRLLRAGQLHLVLSEKGSRKHSSNHSDWDLRRIRGAATSEFLTRGTNHLIPRIISMSASTLVQSSVTKDGRRRLLENDFLKEYCSVLYDHFDDDVAKKALQALIPPILADTLFLRSCSDTESIVADEVVRLMEGLLTGDVVQRKSDEGASLVLRRVIEIIGEASTSVDNDSLLDSLRTFLKTNGKKSPKRGGDPFGGVGSSAVELLLLVKFHLNTSCTASQMVLRWNSADVVFRLIVDEIGSGGRHGHHFSFCVHILLSFVLDTNLVPIRIQALRVLQELIRAATFSSGSQLSADMKKLLGTVLGLHRTCQQNLVSFCSELQLGREKVRRQSVGLLSSWVNDGDTGDVWGWAAERDLSSYDVPFSTLWREYRSHVSSSLVECLVVSFDLLRDVVQNAGSLGISQEVVGCIRFESGEMAQFLALADAHSSFSAQLLIAEFLNDSTSIKNDKIDVSNVATRLSLYGSSNLTFLRAELTEIERFLHELRLNETGQSTLQLKTGEDIRLFQALTRFCSRSMPQKIRIAASRCLGEIDLASFYAHHPDYTTELSCDDDRLASSIASGNLLKALQANVVECLTVSLRSPEPRVAMVAMDTLKAVLSSRVGKDCLELITEPMTATTLQTLVSCSRPLQKSVLFLTTLEIDQIRQRDSNESEENDREWCWGNSFWRIGTSKTSSFESWICRLVPALLICCYDVQESSHRIGRENSFFTLYQRMSCLDPTIAQALFPAVVLDLLLREGYENEQTDLDRVLTDTWIGRHDSRINLQLSRCFDVLLRNCNEGFDRRVVELAVEVLDYLRRLTQERFVSSPNHKRNKFSRTKETRKGSILPETPSTEVDGPWRGVPFGVVLALDGKLVATACIQSRRFESALFYAELYADASFGGSNCSLEVLALDRERRKQRLHNASIRDISGFGQRCDANGDIETDCLSFLAILRCCFSELDEEDGRKAVDQQRSDFAFVSEQGTVAMSSLLASDAPSLQQLQLLDNMSCMDHGSVTFRLSMADCLEGLGLHSALETYIAGLTAFEGESTFGDDFLREKLFKCRLYAMQWNDSLFQPETSTDSGFSGQPTDSFSMRLTRSDHLRTDAHQAGSFRIEHSGGAGFYELIVGALHTLRRDDFETSRNQLLAARLEFVDMLESLGTETAAFMSMHDTVDHLQVLNDLEDFVASSGSTEMLQRRFGLLSAPAGEICYNPGSRKSFSDCVREITLRSFRSKSTDSQRSLTESLASHLLAQFESNLQDGRHKDSDGALKRLYSLMKSANKSDELVLHLSPLQLRLHEATLFESRGDFTDAIRSAKLTINHLKQKIDRDVEENVTLADALAKCGTWMTKYKVEPASSVLANYLQPAADISKTIYGRLANKRNADRAAGALLAQGQLLSNLFETVSARVNSLEWQKAEASLSDREKEVNSLDRQIKTAHQKLSKKKREDPANEAMKELKEREINRLHLQKEIKATRAQRITILHSMEAHRTMAMQSIVSALTIAGVSASEDMPKHAYRLVGLWFSSDSNWSECVDTIIKDAINNIPSFRFVPLVTQLFSRITNTSTQTISFQNRLQELVRRISLHHPYHCVIHLITLAEGTSNGSATETVNDKEQAARSILKDLEKDDPQFVAELIESYKKLTAAYIHLAMANTAVFNRGTANDISFDEVCKNTALRLDRCLGSGSRKAKFLPCILTKPPLLSPGCVYGDGIDDPIGSERVDSFDSTFAITDTGVNQPKIVVCIGTKGGRFKQLVKGNDDTRQDAVMEQVFGYANELMARQRRTNAGEARRRSKHELRLVTYNVLPLNHRAGVLEWVEHSAPFGDFIADKGGKADGSVKALKKVAAHSRYYPGEWSGVYCNRMLADLRKSFKERASEGARGENEVRDDKNKLRAAFDLICKHNSPVFRFFFVENFAAPEIWYASKMRYTRSVAVSSVVGHILGIGDRHSSNILVHQRSGEVIHIDFGIVFEQGKRLVIPETVPFRLTRNVIDGMGPLGIEGTFTKAAEATLSVLKQNANGLLTILSAIVSDPLYKWRNGCTKANRQQQQQDEEDNRRQNSDNSVEAHEMARDENTNEVAAHAIARIHEKLLGYEDGTSGEQQSVESQVQLLVNAARDPDNLCVMFPGWAPWQ